MLVHRFASHSHTGRVKLALAIGNFDGLHQGHRTILKKLTDFTAARDLRSAVMLFEPQPKEYFLPNNPPARIQSWQEKVMMLQELGIDEVIIARFNPEFQHQSAQTFCRRLRELHGVDAVFVGDDFRFGENRVGDSEYLKNDGFEVVDTPSVLNLGERVSSTLIRSSLARGDFAEAKRFLGRDYSMSGRVIYGDQIGRTLDFPTANIKLSRPKPALHGVYAVDVQTLYEKDAPRLLSGGGIKGLLPGSLLGAAHIGTRPAIKNKKPEWRFEVNLPEFAADLYGIKLKVTFYKLIHGEKDYESLALLKAGIDSDVKQIKQWRLDQS